MWKGIREWLRFYFFGTDTNRLYQAEIDCLQESGIDMSLVQVRDIWLDFNEYTFVNCTDPDEMYMHYVTIRQATSAIPEIIENK